MSPVRYDDDPGRSGGKADAAVSNTAEGNLVWVRIPSSAPSDRAPRTEGISAYDGRVDPSATVSRPRLTVPAVAAGCFWLASAGFLAFVTWVYMAVAVFDPILLLVIAVPAALGAVVLAKPTLARLLVSLIASVVVITYALVATILSYND